MKVKIRKVKREKNNTSVKPNTETCVCCGDEIPEGRQVCHKCEKEFSK